jgi:hypothetical protein
LIIAVAAAVVTTAPDVVYALPPTYALLAEICGGVENDKVGAPIVSLTVIIIGIEVTRTLLPVVPFAAPALYVVISARIVYVPGTCPVIVVEGVTVNRGS